MQPGLDERGVILMCPSCNTPNRLAYATIDKRTRCPRCKSMLPPPGAAFEATSSSAFNAAASASAIPLVVDFWAAWCGPCRMVAPEVEKVAKSHAGQWLVIKVDTDRLTDVAAQYKIMSLPTLAVIQHGRELARIVGVRPAPEIERFVADATAKQTTRAS
jgi:thioredoxin 2